MTDPGPGRVWHLAVTTFRGVSVGAVHFYAKLHGPDQTLELGRPLTEADAAALRERDGFDWEPGWPTDRWDTREDVVAAGIAVFTALAGPGSVLLDGRIAVAQPQPVLAGPDELVQTLRPLHEAVAELEASSPDREAWLWFPQRMEDLCKAWWSALAPLRDTSPAIAPRPREVLVQRDADGTWTLATPTAADAPGHD